MHKYIVYRRMVDCCSKSNCMNWLYYIVSLCMLAFVCVPAIKYEIGIEKKGIEYIQTTLTHTTY